jgi:hypothetical protein
MIDAALAGVPVEQYRGGAVARAREIEDGAGREAPELFADLRAGSVSGASWRITGTSVTLDDDPADFEIAGTGADLLAWLFGRGAHGLDAPHLPDLLPYA